MFNLTLVTTDEANWLASFRVLLYGHSEFSRKASVSCDVCIVCIAIQYTYHAEKLIKNRRRCFTYGLTLQNESKFDCGEVSFNWVTRHEFNIRLLVESPNVNEIAVSSAPRVAHPLLGWTINKLLLHWHKIPAVTTASVSLGYYCNCTGLSKVFLH